MAPCLLPHKSVGKHAGDLSLTHNLPNDTAAQKLLRLVEQLVHELHPEFKIPSVHLNHSLQNTLGIDSLGRSELLSRIETEFEVQINEALFFEAETVSDLLKLLKKPGPILAETQEIPVITPLEMTPAPAQASTLIEVMDWHLERRPDSIYLHFYPIDRPPETLTYRELNTRSQQVASHLIARGLRSGQTVALMIPSSLSFFECFFGILRAGGIPVPLYPPDRMSQIEEHVLRQSRILANSQVRFLITSSEIKKFQPYLKSFVPQLEDFFTPDEFMTEWDRHPISDFAIPDFTIPDIDSDLSFGNDIALLQYTSGSTGSPKGVTLTHANLLANIRAMGDVVEATSSDIFVSWLPLYHDMGLIGACLGTLYYGGQLIHMPPQAFLARPIRWLRAIDHHRGTLSAAPNFGYELCARKISEAEMQDLNLSSWRAAFNGAEPVSWATLQRFSQKFVKKGFHPHAMMPVYGLAENSVGLAFPPLDRGPRMDCIDRDEFFKTGQAKPTSLENPITPPLLYVSNGFPLPHHRIRIVNDLDQEVAERQNGHLHFRGPSATSGYFHNFSENRKLFHENWLDSGDTAYIADGEIFITGRSKDVIIRAGRHLFPYEIEETVGDLRHIRKGCVAVFGSNDPETGTERLIVAAERLAEESDAEIRAEINHLVMNEIGSPPDEIILLKPRSIPKTPSGKIRRSTCRELYEQGQLGKKHSTFEQFFRLTWAGLRFRLGRFFYETLLILYGVYSWLIAILMGLCAIPGLLLFSSFETRYRHVHFWARLAFRLTGISVTVHGLENILQKQNFILVANHASYLDGILLTAIIPIPIRFVAKRELSRRFLVGWILNRLGSLFVERFETEKALSDTQTIVDALHQKDSVAFFPEGRLMRTAGLQNFFLGAFIASCQSQVPVLPLSIQGTRMILRDGNWRAHPGKITITISSPLFPKQNNWAEALYLRKTAREKILRHCGEIDFRDRTL